MEIRHVRVASLVEWLVAAGCLVGLLAAGSAVVSEAPTVNAVTPVIAGEPGVPQSPAPSTVPARATSLPVLLLPDGHEVRVGDTLTAIASRLGRQAEVGIQTVEPVATGERLTRFYEHAGTDFILVFEPFVSEAEPRVAAIYLQ